MTDGKTPLSREDVQLEVKMLGGAVRIPPQPRVLEELRQLLERREFDIRQLAKVIRQDPGIVSMLFKVVGNPSFKQHQPFESVEQILHAVGVRQTFNMVRAICVATHSGTSAKRALLEAFWARSQAIAQIAMLVAADRVTVCNIFPDQAYLAGIFHDCGIPLLMERFPAYCQEMHLTEPEGWVDVVEEDARFNTDHCVIGYLVAKHWNLPAFICDAIRYHHDMEAIQSYAARSMVAILHIAVEIYCRDRQIPDPDWKVVEGEVLSELGIHQDGLSEFIDDMLERYHEQLEMSA